ncbi:MAG: hypothetical protein RL020_2118 [Pseudomonadota bacterium]|jgi:hypothetical protein
MKIFSVFAIVGLIVLAALFMSRGFLNKRNIDEREKYWKKEIFANLKVGATKVQMEEFLKSRGENLHCYQNYSKEDMCDVTDKLSFGGTSSKPMKLAVIFKMKDDKMISYSFTTTLANQPQ